MIQVQPGPTTHSEAHMREDLPFITARNRIYRSTERLRERLAPMKETAG